MIYSVIGGLNAQQLLGQSSFAQRRTIALGYAGSRCAAGICLKTAESSNVIQIQSQMRGRNVGPAIAAG